MEGVFLAGEKPMAKIWLERLAPEFLKILHPPQTGFLKTPNFLGPVFQVVGIGMAQGALGG